MNGSSIQRYIFTCAVSLVLYNLLIICEARLISDVGFRPAWETEISSPLEDDPVMIQKYRESQIEPLLAYSAKKQHDPILVDPTNKRWQPSGIDLKDAYRKMAMAIILHRKTLRSQNYIEGEDEGEGRKRRYDNGVLLPDLRTRLTLKH